MLLHYVQELTDVGDFSDSCVSIFFSLFVFPGVVGRNVDGRSASGYGRLDIALEGVANHKDVVGLDTCKAT
jgi:hypothetical protein